VGCTHKPRADIWLTRCILSDRRTQGAYIPLLSKGGNLARSESKVLAHRAEIQFSGSLAAARIRENEVGRELHRTCDVSPHIQCLLRGEFMKFYAISEVSGICVFTDDYDEKEIANKLHLRHLRDDARRYPKFKYPIQVFDQNSRFICTLEK